MRLWRKTAISGGITESEFDLTDIGDLLNSIEISSKIVIKEKAGSLYNYTITGSAAMEDTNCSFDMSGDQMNVLCNLTFDQKDAVKLTIDLESHIKVSAAAPDLTLPSDAVVVDYPVFPAY